MANREERSHGLRAAFGGDVTPSHGYKKRAILLFPFILAGIAAAASPDPRLLSLVPPDAQLVAGISPPAIQDQPDHFFLMTRNNGIDLEDFFALTGADSSRNIQQIVFVAVASNDGRSDEHSLLVSGRFDQPHVFQSAIHDGASATSYRRIPVLEIQPFARERGLFKDVRWLAVLNSSVAVFGDIASTQVEVDRYLARTPIDESLFRRLAHLRSKDQTWFVSSAAVGTLASPAWDQEIRRVLARLNPELAELVQSSEAFEFGIRYGRRVEFEYEVTLPLSSARLVGTDLTGQPAVETAGRESLLPPLNTAREANRRHGVIEISMSRYKAWLERIRRERLPTD
jgi:hypothetical protein